MRDQCIRADGQRTRRLDRIRQLQLGGGSQPCGAFRDLGIQVYDEPGPHRTAVSLRQHFVAISQGPGKHLRERDGRHRKARKTLSVGFEYRSEYGSELAVVLEHVNDRGGVDQQQRILRQPLEGYRVHSSLSRRSVARLSRP